MHFHRELRPAPAGVANYCRFPSARSAATIFSEAGTSCCSSPAAKKYKSPPDRRAFFPSTNHLMHFTFGVTNPEFMDMHDGLGRHDVYRMVVGAFRNPWVSV